LLEFEPKYLILTQNLEKHPKSTQNPDFHLNFEKIKAFCMILAQAPMLASGLG
jgi:hypothetical protein